MDYQQAIQACIDDLSQYQPSELSTLATYYNVDFENLKKLAEQIMAPYTHTAQMPAADRELMRAAKQGELDQVNALLAAGEANPGVQDVSTKVTPLIFALMNKHPEIAKVLLATGNANPGAQNLQGLTALMYAVRENYSDIVTDLLATGEANPGAQNKGGHTALLMAVVYHHLDIATAILATGKANPGAQNIDRTTALMLAVHGDNVELVKALLATGEANPDAYDRAGRTALIMAAKEGKVSMVKALLDSKKVNPALQDTAGKTALFYAVENNNLDMVNALLATGRANPGAHTSWGWTALISATQNRNLEMVKALLASGEANPGKQETKHGFTALMIALVHNDWEIINALLASGEATPGAQNIAGETALMIAARDGYRDVVKALLETGAANPGAQNKNGDSALMVATDPEIKKMIMASFPYKTKGQVMNAMARGELNRKDGQELMKELPVTVATKEEIAAAECSPPAEYKVCTNDKDIATNECWSTESPPELVFSFLDPTDPSHKPYTLCLRREQFRNWVTDPENEYRGWYPNADNQRAGKTLDDIHPEGYGGAPSKIETFIKLPGEIHVYVGNLRPQIIAPPVREMVGYPIFMQKRIGNVSGTFGIGAVHGQAPGETIYYLLPMPKYMPKGFSNEDMLKRVYHYYHEIKRGDKGGELPDTIEEILAKFKDIKDEIPLVDKV